MHADSCIHSGIFLLLAQSSMSSEIHTTHGKLSHKHVQILITWRLHTFLVSLLKEEFQSESIWIYLFKEFVVNSLNLYTWICVWVSVYVFIFIQTLIVRSFHYTFFYFSKYFRHSFLHHVMICELWWLRKTLGKSHIESLAVWL